MNNKIAILGGGASGLICASNITNNADVTIFEQEKKQGKKILLTGNGRCNLANKYMNKYSYNTDLKKYFNKINAEYVLNYFNKLGLEYYADEEGRIYPISNSANSVLDVLNKKIEQNNNIKVCCNIKVLDIKKNNNKYIIIFDDNTSQIFDKVVVATGNKTNLSIYKKLNISCNDFAPSLCSVISNVNNNLSGVRLNNVCVTCKLDNDVFKEKGEILFKKDAISGIVIFNLSCFIVRRNKQNLSFFIDFLPNFDKNSLFFNLKQRKEILKEQKCKDFFCGMFVGALGDDLLSKAHINHDDKIKNLNNDKILKLVDLIKNYKLNCLGFEQNNQVKIGGVKLNELDKNLQSVNNNNLYFVGEVVDVDGMCGGYNLLWAWISGLIVSEAL